MSDRVASVHLLGVPLAIHAAARDHQETLRRELALVDAGADRGVSEQLATLTAELRGRFGAFTTEPHEALQRAAAEGAGTVDLTYDVPPDAADAAERLLTLLDEVDALCRSGQLVTLVTPPAARAYRRWFLGEFVAQIRAGRPPRAWDPLLVASEVEPADDERGGDGVLVAGVELDLLSAPTLRAAIASRLEAGATSIVVDLAGCEFIDSVGLSLLLTTRERCRALGGSFEVIGAGENALRLFETAGVRDLLVRHPPS